MSINLNLTGKEVDDAQDDSRKAELASWVMTYVEEWRRQRNTNFSKKWAEYYRLWRGFWDPADKNKDAERSRLIAPALQQAVEMTVSEMEEATFGRDMWLDMVDDYEDQEKEDVEVLRDRLIEEIDLYGTKASVSESYLNGALYGTGIGKIMIGRTAEGQFKSWLDPISPTNFVIDPTAKIVDEALGCAHEMNVPKHKVQAKQKANVYYDCSLGTWQGDSGMFNSNGEQLSRDLDNDGAVFITEYHGLVPRRLLDSAEYKKNDEKYPEMSESGYPEHEEDELVEAIVTIANEGVLLRAVPNPFENKAGGTDRAIISYQHETVPNQFWGRGVSEKGYNPQKALDAELRARIDALGLLTYPVMGIDATRIPRGVDFRIRPGKTILTQGRPSEVLEPITFGNLNPATFQQSSDLERMVQMGTGAMDSAIPTGQNRRNETSGGMSMMQSGFVKRAKRTMQNVERNFLTKMVQKMLNRYCQFDEDRFPKDFKFRVFASMGIMAREVEQQIYAQLLQSEPPESPLRPLIIKEIIQNSSAGKRNGLLQALEQASQPNPQAQQEQAQISQLRLQNALLENEKLKAEVLLAQAQTINYQSTAKYTDVKAGLEDEKIEIMAAQTVISNKKLDHDSAHRVVEHTHKHKELEHKKMELRANLVSGHADRSQKAESDKQKNKAKPKK